MKDKAETGIVFDRDVSQPETKLKKRMKKPKSNDANLDLDPTNQMKGKDNQPPQENNMKRIPKPKESINPVKQEPEKPSLIQTPYNKPKENITPITVKQATDNKLSILQTPIGKEIETFIPMNVDKKYEDPHPQVKVIEKDNEFLQKESVDDEQNDWINNSNKAKIEVITNINNNDQQNKAKPDTINIYDNAQLYINNKISSNNDNTNNTIPNNSNRNDKIKYVILKCHRECNEMSKLIDELSSKKDYTFINNNINANSTEKMDQNEYNFQLKALRIEMSKRDKVIHSLTQTNNKQRQALESLSKQIDEKLGKVSITRNIPQSKTSNSTRDKDNPFKKELKLKDKELKNAVALIEILSKDNAQLKTSLETYGDYKKKLQLLDLTKSKDSEIHLLENEIALLKHEIEDHKQCRITKQNFEYEVVMLRKEIKMYKKEISELKKKQMAMNLIDTTQNEKNLPLLNTKSKLVNNTNINTVENNKMNKSKSKPKMKQTSMSNKKDEKPKTTKERIDFKKDMYYDKFLSDEEKTALISFFTVNDKYEAFIKKINIMEKYKISFEAKHKNIVEKLMDQIASLDEQIEYLNQKNKESESRLKIFQFQVNEYKHGKMVYQKKLNEYQSSAHILENQVKEKKQEINLLAHKLDSIRSQTVGNKNDNTNHLSSNQFDEDYVQEGDNNGNDYDDDNNN